MGVYIKGMEMPTSCDQCPFLAEADEYNACFINEEFIPWEWANDDSVEQIHPKPLWCPLAPVPEHGRLIDADALVSVLAILQDKGSNAVVWEQMRYIADDMPTIIPADKEVEG